MYQKIVNNFENKEIFELNVEIKEQIIKDYCKIYDEELPINTECIKYYGEYRGCYAVMFTCRQTLQIISVEIIGGVKITYPNGHRILIWTA